MRSKIVCLTKKFAANYPGTFLIPLSGLYRGDRRRQAGGGTGSVLAGRLKVLLNGFACLPVLFRFLAAI